MYLTPRVPLFVVVLAAAASLSSGAAGWVAAGLDALLVCLIVADVVLAPGRRRSASAARCPACWESVGKKR